MVQTKRFFFINWHLNHVLWHAKQSDSDIHQITERTKEKAPWTCNRRHVNRVVLHLETRDFPHCGGGQLRPEVQLLTLFQIYTFFAPFTYLDSRASGRNSCPWLRLQGCYGCAIRKVLPYCGIDTCTSVLKLLFCSGSTLGVFSCNGEASMWKSGEARQTDCKLHLSINCKRPKVATVSGWNFLKQLKEKDSQITESNFIPLD